jgi:DNA-binding LytR/AlgR family response regulator
MRVLIVEDERPAASRLTRLITEIDGSAEVVHVAPSVEDATNWLANNPHPDLAFMDIQLADGLSFEIFDNIDFTAPVIFTTAYDQYSLRAFKVNSIDYLLKPVRRDELEKAINKYRHLHSEKLPREALESLIRRLQPQARERFLIRVGDHYRPVQATDISCFYVIERSVFLADASGRSYGIDYSLDRIESMVDGERFFRVSRSSIVNYSSIKDIVAWSSSRLKISLHNHSGIPEIVVSRDRVAKFKNWIDR